MDETRRDSKTVKPGIPEALHPEIGNGSLLQNSRHASLLRSPDPMKALDALLTHEENGAVQPEEADTSPVALPINSPPVTSSPLPVTDPIEAKAPKAGKRIRKAVKTVRKQEQLEPPEERPSDPVKSDSTLSPYAQWLKSLRGSEYVHPYDDDFALEQGARQAREGISETFADLLAAQGHKDRAIEMYQKLIEKNPEKSGFFAAKIKALE